MNWKIGDIAIVVKSGYIDPTVVDMRIFGEEVEIIGLGVDDYDWEIQDRSGERYYTREKCLRPLPPPNEITSWDECIFKPMELVNVA